MSSATDPFTDPSALVRRAQENVTRAAVEWTPVDAARITECVSALDSAASDLHTVMESFRPEAASANNPEYRQMRADLLALKQSLVGLNRIMDASAAFIRNLPGQHSGETYAAGGQLCTVAVSPMSSVEA
jgi:hypothetical protein